MKSNAAARFAVTYRALAAWEGFSWMLTSFDSLEEPVDFCVYFEFCHG